MALDELYQEIILDHHKRPRFKGKILNADAATTLFNPLCGDQVQIELRSDGKTVSEIAHDGQGCSISQASASMMSEICKGKPIEEVRELIEIFGKMMKGTATEEEQERLGDAESLKGVQRFAARIKCAMLSWEACDQCIKKLPEGAPAENDSQES